MKIYRIHMGGDFGADDSQAVWFTRKADKAKITRQLYEDADDPHPSTFQEFDVPTNKAGLVAFLNHYANR